MSQLPVAVSSLSNRHIRFHRNLILARSNTDFGLDVSSYVQENHTDILSQNKEDSQIVFGSTSGFSQEFAMYEPALRNPLVLHKPITSLVGGFNNDSPTAASGIGFMDRLIRAAYKLEMTKPRFLVCSCLSLAVETDDSPCSLSWDLRRLSGLTIRLKKLSIVHEAQLYDTCERKSLTVSVQRPITMSPMGKFVDVGLIMRELHASLGRTSGTDPFVSSMFQEALLKLKQDSPAFSLMIADRRQQAVIGPATPTRTPAKHE